jgi:hypothetical protein
MGSQGARISFVNEIRFNSEQEFVRVGGSYIYSNEFWRFGSFKIEKFVVRVPGYRYRGLGSIPGATRFSDK